jgi:hypothetical protein
MLKGIAASLVLSLMLVASCSSSGSSGSSDTFSCDNAKSKCPNDPPLDPVYCKKATEEPNCGSLVLNMFKCIGAHQTCLADGTTDQSVSQRECASEFNAVANCTPADGG